MIEDLTKTTLLIFFHKNTNEFDVISSLHNLLTDNFKQCQTYVPTNQLPLTEKNKSLFILHINIR